MPMNHPLGEEYDFTMKLSTGVEVGIETVDEDDILIHYEDGTIEDAKEVMTTDDMMNYSELYNQYLESDDDDWVNDEPV